MTQAFAPCIPENAPFTPEQRAWLNGFLAGLFSRQPTTPAAAALQPLTILWGSQTGTAEKLARQAAKAAQPRGFAPRVIDMAEATPTTLVEAGPVLLITSTYGDGEPPDNARAFLSALRDNTAPALKDVRYSVCALGDSSYRLFCQCGKEFDDALSRLGATAAVPRVECDVDYEAPFEGWLEQVFGQFGGAVSSPAPVAVTPAETAHPESAYNKKNPFMSRVLSVRRLNGAGSAKEVNHVELSLEDSGLEYQVGDALGVLPQNCPDLVDQVLLALDCDGEEPVNTPSGERPLRTALLRNYDLGKPSADLLRLLELPPDENPHHVIDALCASHVKLEAGVFTGALRKLQPRLYSISSSPKAHPGQVHLTVGAVRYETHGRTRKGACSTFLAERALSAGTVGVFVHQNTAFRLPADSAAPVIMIGPGTGIAPFRAFLEERAATGAVGRNWLFFGDQHADTDFLYREEIESWLNCGLLTRLETAFSRDQAEKIYVQHRMLEYANDLWSWLEEGAHVYVCGDASRMARDVDAALLRVVETAGNMSSEDAAAYVQKLRASRRYLRDVY